MNRGNVALFYEMGTGKTAIALTWVHDHILDGTLDEVLVVGPAPVMDSWYHAIDKMAMFEGFWPEDIDIMHEVITLRSFGKVWTKDKRTGKYAIRDDIDHHWDAVIIDESHGLGDHASVQTKACLQLARMTERRYIMTGTPDNGIYTKLYGQISFLYPDTWKNWTAFKKRAVLAENKFHKPIAYDVEYCEGLKHRYGIVARLRDCVDLPGMTETDVICPLKAKKVYKEVLGGHWEEYHLTCQTAGAVFTKLLQLVSGHMRSWLPDPSDPNGGPVRDADGHISMTTVDYKTSKLDALTSLVTATDDKVVVFAKFTRSIDQIADRLCQEHIPYLRFDGSVKDSVWRTFQDDPSVRVFVTQYQRGGTGIDLYASHICVYYEPTFSAHLLEQSRARIMRTGQTEHCLYYYLTTPGTVEERVWTKVREGVDISTALLDEWAREDNIRVTE